MFAPGARSKSRQNNGRPAFFWPGCLLSNPPQLRCRRRDFPLHGSALWIKLSPPRRPPRRPAAGPAASKE